MGKVTLDLTYYDSFNMACYQLGRFFADDSTEEERVGHLDNIHILRKNMDEKHLNGFNDISKQFESKKDEMMAKSEEFYNKYAESMKEIFYPEKK